MQLVIGFYAQGIIKVHTVVNGEVAHHFLFLLIGNHVAETGNPELFASHSIIRIEQDSPIFRAHNGAPAAVPHD